MAAVAADTPVKGFPPALPAADLVLRDASIATLDPLQPHAQALAVKDGKTAAREAKRYRLQQGGKTEA